MQLSLIHSIIGLEKAEILRPAYAIEYDYVKSGQLKLSLETKLIKGLFFAGQINGTTGYEEAAGQGLIAGINAACLVFGKNPLLLKRSDAYIGVMIDELTTKELDEPYRMFTSRAEHRLILRQDNCDLRLRQYGYDLGLISEEQYRRLQEKKEIIATQIQKFSTTFKTVEGKTSSLAQLLCRPDFTYARLNTLFPEHFIDFGEETTKQIELQLKFAGYIERQNHEVSKLNGFEEIVIPDGITFAKLQDCQMKLKTNSLN